MHVLTKQNNVPMDQLCELASNITEYIWSDVMHKLSPHSFTDDAGDLRYVDDAQDIFNNILDIIDDQLNPEEWDN